MKLFFRVSVGLLALAAFFIMPAPGRADTTRYVSDQLIITLRADKGPDAKILTTLKTGTPLEVLAQGPHYAKVRTQKGLEGYVKKQYLDAETPKPVIIAGLRKERDQLADQVTALKKSRDEMAEKLDSASKNLREQVQQAQNKAGETATALAASQKQLQELTAKYNALKKNSQQVVALVKERDQLKSENEQLSSEAEKLRNEEARTLYTGMIQWFLAGGGVFFFGWLLGKFSRKKRRTF